MATSVAALLIVALLAAQTGAGAPPPAAESQPAANGSVALDPEDLPVDLDRIQRALARPPALKLETKRPVFRVEVFGRNPTIEDILGPDFLRGPVPYGGMTHNEFLNMVTPRDVQGYAAFSNKQAVTVAATSFALQWALRQALQKYNDARQER